MGNLAQGMASISMSRSGVERNYTKMKKRGRRTQSLVLTHAYIDLLKTNTSNFERLVARAPRFSSVKAQNTYKEKLKYFGSH